MSVQRLLPPMVLALFSISFVAAAPAVSPADLKRPERGNILIITVESLRADRLGCYSAGQKSTPAIDALAARGVRFSRAYSASPSTVPSAGTILTGLYPIRHGLRNDLEGRLADGIVPLAEIVARAGYRTGAVIGSSHLDSRFGLDRGFGKYDDVIKSTTAKTLIAISKERSAGEVVARGLEFLDSGNKEQPFLLWLDLFDPHYEYTPPGSLAKDFEKDPYQGEVTYVDQQITVLMAGLQERTLDQNTLVVLAGSHGEGLGDHRETGHGIYLYESTIKVPLIIVPAGARPEKAAPPRVIDRPVGLVDMLPTVLDLVGIDPPGGLDGISLTSLLPRGSSKEPKRTAAAGRRLFVEAVQPWAAYGWSPLFAVIEGDHKLVHGVRTESFDLRTDPAEMRPASATPKWAAGLENFGRPLLGTLGLPEKERQKIAPLLASLELPWSGEPYCLERLDWPDPRDRVDLNDRLFRARAVFDKGWVGEASAISSEILEVDPGNPTALELVSFLAVRNGWVDVFKEKVALLQCAYPFRGTSYHYWAHFRERSKDPRGAEKAFLAFSQLEPQDDEAFYDLAAFYAGQDKKDLALDNLRRAIGLGSNDFEKIRQDQRLHPLQDDPRFLELVGGGQPHPPASPR